MRVERWVAKWSKKDTRYKTAFDRWLVAEYAPASDLRTCFVDAGLSSDTAEARLRELRKLGFSGEIPKRYWLNLDDRALIDGATYAETEKLHRLAAGGKPVDELLLQRKARMRKAVSGVRKAVLGITQTPQLRTAPMRGELTATPIAVGKRAPTPPRKPSTK